MEEWFAVSVLGAALFGSSIAMDKINFHRYLKNPLEIVPINGILSVIVGLALIPLFGLTPQLDSALVLGLLSGVIYLIGNLFYYKALFIDDSPNISALLRLVPVFLLVFGFLAFHEEFKASAYLGIGLLILGAMGVSAKKLSDIFKPSKVLTLMATASFFYAISLIIVKILVASTDYLLVFAYVSIGIGISSLLFSMVNEEAKTGIRWSKSHLFGPFLLCALAALLNMGGEMANTKAFTTAPAAFVTAITSAMPLFTLLISIFLSSFFPHLLDEDVDAKVLVRKIAFILMLIVGAWLLA